MVMKEVLQSSSYRLPFICLIIFTAISISGCTKFVNVQPPITTLVTGSVFNNNAGATAAQTAIYSQMVNNYDPYDLPQNTGLLGDELTNYSTDLIEIQFFTNAMDASNSPGPWSNAYSYIYQANAVLAGVTGNSDISPAIRQQLTGEAEFIRAFWYFYLTNLYGDVPLLTTTNYSVNAVAARTAQTLVYKQIISDLLDAQNLLNTNYVDVSDTTITRDRIRPTKWAATALLARVYLYTGDYSNALTQASTVINNSSMYSLVSDLNSVFLANSTEAIWQLGIPLPATQNTPEGANFILTGAPSSGSGNCTTLSPQLLGAFESGDSRRSDWVDSAIVSSNIYYFPYKYKVQAGSNITEYSMVLRLAEQYLIRAEAEANGAGGGIPAAITDLNVIRSRAALSPYAGGTDKGSVLTAILHERQVELFTEWGHRWLDLNRTGAVDTVMGAPQNVAQNKGGQGWNANDKLYPIPQTELTNDPNLHQNEGY